MEVVAPDCITVISEERERFGLAIGRKPHFYEVPCEQCFGATCVDVLGNITLCETSHYTHVSARIGLWIHTRYCTAFTIFCLCRVLGTAWE